MTYLPRRIPRRERLTLRGLDHHVLRWGPDDATPWVLLHGWADCAESFQFLVDAFEGDHALVALDWRGFGESAWQGGPYWFPDYLADLEALLDAVTPAAPATIVGHSMGGNLACLYAGIRPERVARVVNLEGLGMRRTRPTEAPERYRRWLSELGDPPAFARYEALEAFAAVLRRRNPRLTEERARFVARLWSAPRADGGWTVRADPAHKFVNPVLYRREEAEACWQAATAPLLIALGAESPLTGQLGADASEEYLRRHHPTLTLVTVPEAGHMLHHDAPEAVAALIEAFLQDPAA